MFTIAVSCLLTLYRVTKRYMQKNEVCYNFAMKKRIVPLFFTTALLLTACGGKNYSPSDYIVGDLNYKANFKILQLTDIHMSDKDDQDLHYAFMDKLISEAKAGSVDFMVVTGDLFTFASRGTAERLFKFLDSYQIPWTVVFGNHDEQTYFSVDWMTGYLNKLSNKSQYCMFKDIQDDKVQGNCNFAINLKNADGTIHNQLIFMDSNRYYFGSYFGYDYFKEDQMKWYEDLVDYTKTQNNGAVANSLMFYHIPLYEINDAYDKGTKVFDGRNGNDGKREDTCPPKENSGFFDRIKAKGSTKAMFFGHDHINTFEVDYEGVKFCYGIKSTDRIYYNEDLLGYQTITIQDDNQIKVERHFHTYEEVK